MKNVLIGLLGGIVLAGAAVAGWVMFGRNWQPDENRKIEEVKEVIPTPASKPTTETSAPAESTDVSLGNNTRKFTSPALGITFTYLEKQNEVTIATLEKKNKVYVYMTNTQPTSGQYVEVFPKEGGVTTEAAIKANFLKGFSSTDCLVEPAAAEKKYVNNFEAWEITVPTSAEDNMETLSNKWDKCPKVYTSTNGLSYFLGDKTHPTKYVYFSIGQYGIQASGNKGWQETLQISD